MINSQIINELTHGMYVLTTADGGCIVDAVAQVGGGDLPLIAVSVMKKNLTNKLMKNNDRFALSIIGENTDPSVIPAFGFKSARDTNKFDGVETTDVAGVKIINASLGYLVCEKIDAIENETHTLFIGRVTEGDVLKTGEPMTYRYYKQHKDELLKANTENGKTAWVCSVCGYVYYGDEVPSDYVCPICGVGKDFFERQG